MRLIMVLCGLLHATWAYSVPWPILMDPKITTCRDSNTLGPCTQGVYYSTSGVQMIEVAPVGSPNVGNVTTDVRPVGVHCQTGNALIGVFPFGSCSWRDYDHRPDLVGTCRLKDLTSWSLTQDSNCAVASTWGYHSGAGPGGECVVFTNTSRRGTVNRSVNTPWGALTADQAANSGNRFCSKPLPPTVTCELQLPSLIDHGQLRAGETSKRTDDGVVHCGGAPKIDVLVNGDRDVGGVRISATPLVVNQTSVRITSEITVSSSAVPGEHSATYVFVASPY